MNKILQRLVYAEIIIDSLVLLSGFYDPSFWLWGIILVCGPATIIVFIIALIFLIRSNIIGSPNSYLFFYKVILFQVILFIPIIFVFLWASAHLLDNLGSI